MSKICNYVQMLQIPGLTCELIFYRTCKKENSSTTNNNWKLEQRLNADWTHGKAVGGTHFVSWWQPCMWTCSCQLFLLLEILELHFCISIKVRRNPCWLGRISVSCPLQLLWSAVVVSERNLVSPPPAWLPPGSCSGYRYWWMVLPGRDALAKKDKTR